MPVIVSDPDLYPAMLSAADAAGSIVIHARVSWLRSQLGEEAPPVTSVRAGCRVAMLRCSPPPCVELWAVGDDEIASDWVVG